MSVAFSSVGGPMDAGLVTSLSGALAQSKQVEVIANNLANTDTVGFKSDEITFEESLQGAQHPDMRSDIPERPFTETELISRSGDERRSVLYGHEYTNLRAGAFRQTGNVMDVAIEGNGFLEVLTPQGVRLTRAGNLSVDSQGRLVSRDGFPILGAGAAGANPESRVISVGGQDLQIDFEGNIVRGRGEGRSPVGKLSIVQVENPDALIKGAGNLFEAKPEAFSRSGAGTRAPAGVGSVPEDRAPAKQNPLGNPSRAPRIYQGMLESSNVNPVGEMTRLIEAHRLFDQNTKLMQTHGDMTGRVSEIGKF